PTGRSATRIGILVVEACDVEFGVCVLAGNRAALLLAFGGPQGWVAVANVELFEPWHRSVGQRIRIDHDVVAFVHEQSGKSRPVVWVIHSRFGRTSVNVLDVS